jgi:hypothetical protein
MDSHPHYILIIKSLSFDLSQKFPIWLKVVQNNVLPSCWHWFSDVIPHTAVGGYKSLEEHEASTFWEPPTVSHSITTQETTTNIFTAVQVDKHGWHVLHLASLDK